MGVPQVVLRKVDGADILRRIDAARRHAAVRRTGGRRDGARRRRHLGRRDPRPRPHPHGRRRRPAAHPHDRADRDRARLGDHPDLRPHRDGAAAHHQPHPRRVGRAVARRARRAAVARRRAGGGHRPEVDGQGEVLARGNHILKSYWEQPEATADALEGGWFHTGDGGTLDDGGYLTISDRKKDVIISRRRERQLDRGRGLPLLPPRRRRGVRDRRARREVGRDHQGARRAWPRARAPPRTSCAPGARSGWPASSAPPSVEFRDELARTATGKLQKFKLRAPYWEGRERQVN